MPQDKTPSSFEDLEKQLAKDALEVALKKLHEEIIKDIENNKEAFSFEIQKTLSSFKKNLEKSVSEEVDKKLSSLFAKHFKNTSLQVKESFEEMFSPVLETTQDDMNRLHTQGETTLYAWKEMMKPYTHIWNKPFFLMLGVSVLVGSLTSIFSTVFLTRDDRNARKFCESDLHWSTKKYFEMKEALEKQTSKKNDNIQSKNKTQSKKK